MLYDYTINVILCLWVNIVWFNGFNRLRGLIWAEYNEERSVLD